MATEFTTCTVCGISVNGQPHPHPTDGYPWTKPFTLADRLCLICELPDGHPHLHTPGPKFTLVPKPIEGHCLRHPAITLERGAGWIGTPQQAQSLQAATLAHEWVASYLRQVPEDHRRNWRTRKYVSSDRRLTEVSPSIVSFIPRRWQEQSEPPDALPEPYEKSD